jgi:hypothetical protein
MQGNGGGGRHESVQLNKQILDCGSTGELCELIEAHVAEFSLAQATLPAKERATRCQHARHALGPRGPVA